MRLTLPLIFVLGLSHAACDRRQAASAPELLRVNAGDSRLTIETNIFLFEGRPFNGVLVPRGGAGGETPYVEGKIHGSVREWYPDGRLALEAQYEYGDRVGVNRTWWPDGRLRTYEEFSAGKNHGDSWVWDNRGLLVEYVRYDGGQEVGRKKWRSNGRIYANYVYTTERLLGLGGGRLCYKVKDGVTPDKSVQLQ